MQRLDCPSPYARPIANSQYPSQSSGFISLEVQKTPNIKQSNNIVSSKNQSKFYENHHGASSPCNFASSSNVQRKRPFNTQNETRGYSKKHIVSAKSGYDFSAYFHSTMLQDPWENLMKRHQPLRSSKICLKNENG